MKIFNSIILFCVTALVFVSCEKDNEVEKYKDLSTDFVDISTFAKKIVVRQNEVYKNDPVFMPGVDPSKLKYEWRLTKVEYAADPFSGKYVDTILSLKQKLDETLKFAPGDYMLRLHVFDPANGNIAQIINTPLTVSSYAMSGLMLLHGDASSSDVSILVNNKVNTLVAVDVDSIQNNIFSIVNGKKIEGEARSLGFMNHGANGSDSKVYVFTSAGGYRTEFGSLKSQDSYNKMFNVAPSLPNVQSYNVNISNELLIDGGGVYYQGQTQAIGFNPFGVRSFIPGTSTYIATPYVAMDFDNTGANAANVGVFYDQNSRRFLTAKMDNTVGTFTGTVPPPPPAPAPPTFSMSATGKWMVYGEHGNSPSQLSPYFSRYFYCVMSDVNFTSPISPKAGTRKVYICDLGKLPDPAFPNDKTRSLGLSRNERGIAVKDMSAAADMDNAKYFAFGNKGDVMYYATDNKIYLSNNYTTSNLYYDIATNHPGNTITCMKLFKVKDHPSDGKILYVALNNGTQSTLLQIPINSQNGVMNGSVKTYTGISGKILAMNYKPF